MLCMTQMKKTPDGICVYEHVTTQGPIKALCASGADIHQTEAGKSRFGWLYGMLVPKGFPETVAPEYMQYQLWDTLQVMTGDLRGIILSQAGLIAVGVGVKGASPLGTVKVDLYLQLLSTSVGLLAGLVCSSGASVATMKSWRVYNTLLSYFLTITGLLQGIWPDGRLIFSGIGTIAQQIVAPMGRGASQASVMHLSNDSLDAGFRADVAAKEVNQDRVLGLCLMPIRFCLLLYVGFNFYRAWVVAAALSIGHITMNALAVRALKLRTLNNERLLHLAAAWVQQLDVGQPQLAEMTPAAVALQERLLPFLARTSWSSTAFGVQMEQLVDEGDEWMVHKLFDVRKSDRYVLGGSVKASEFRVMLKSDSTSSDQLRAWLHAYLSARHLQKLEKRPTANDMLSAIIECSSYTEAVFPDFFKSLEAAGWAVDHARLVSGRSVLLNARPWRFQMKAD